MYGNPYINNFNQQANIDRINAQMNELEKLKHQLQQTPQQQMPTNLTQNFQLSPVNKEVIKYANSIDEVQRDMVVGDTPYFSKDMTIVWIKNTKGDIKTYELIEIIPKDEKDLQIEYLKAQIDELKGMINDEQSNTNVISTKVTENTSTNDEAIGEPVEKIKSSSVSRVSTSKKK